jgi:hypothetical protein
VERWSDGLSRRDLDHPSLRQEVGDMDEAVGSADSARLPPARVYSPSELSKVLEKQVEARLGAYSVTGLELYRMPAARRQPRRAPTSESR